MCEAVPRSLFWGPNGYYEIPEKRLEFPFILIGKLTMAFLTDQSWHVFNSCYTFAGTQNKDLGTDGLNQNLVLSVAQATVFVAACRKCHQVIPNGNY